MGSWRSVAGKKRTYSPVFKRKVAKAAADLGDWRASQLYGVWEGNARYWRNQLGLPRRDAKRPWSIIQELLQAGPKPADIIARRIRRSRRDTSRILSYHVSKGNIQRNCEGNGHTYTLPLTVRYK